MHLDVEVAGRPTPLPRLTDLAPAALERVLAVNTVAPLALVQTVLPALANGTRYGLQAGVFTKDIDRIFTAHRDIVAGGVIVNDISAFRADQMPYGGSKDSGVGREGLRYAMQEMTEERIVTITTS